MELIFTVKSKTLKTFVMYFGRWQLSTLVLALPMYILEQFGFSAVPNLIIAQCIGCLIFFPIDKFIFK